MQLEDRRLLQLLRAGLLGLVGQVETEALGASGERGEDRKSGGWNWEGEEEKVKKERGLPDVGRRALNEASGLLQLQGRDIEAPPHVLGHAQGHVGLGEAGEETPHFQDSDGTVSTYLIGEVEPLEGLCVHLGEGLW